jgi:hypothetical protein
MTLNIAQPEYQIKLVNHRHPWAAISGPMTKMSGSKAITMTIITTGKVSLFPMPAI